MGQNPVLFYKVFPNRDKMSLEVPQTGSLLANVTGPKTLLPGNFVILVMAHDPSLPASGRLSPMLTPIPAATSMQLTLCE